MKSNDNRKIIFETAVGYFFTIAVMIVVVFVIALLFRQRLNFFKTKYYILYEYGNDIKTGTVVSLNGVNIGDVKEIELDDKNRVKVTIKVWSKWSDKIREDSVAKIVRPLLIGNKQINISPGLDRYKVLPPNSVILSEESSELVDLVSGASLERFVDKIGLNPLFDSTEDIKRISVRELYDMAISSLITMNDFQRSIKTMSNSITGMNDSFAGMSLGLAGMSDAMKEMEKLTDSFDKMGEKMSELSGKMGDMSGKLDGMSKTFVGVDKSMVKMSESLLELDKGLTSNLGQFEPLTDQIISFIKELEIIIEALETNWMFKNDVERIKRQKMKESR
ncbi:MAG TPA: MlaD family protein [Spirochaetota bacterium]|jgi:phospholipid/cholesterol/gamma-HCH transport system substrate-binding protein|nr:MAG: mce related protein [Spirochaetes bacterium ADurb.Bin133]HNZ26161.1 MlaD family protein [Spirochaetota bacterium]HOF01303.1 MlaD family protein [Spirochaetota bacterium]HOS32976.1 MlaD family protein [Spirochaetota bacterium]HOS55757.1 MlaD family protein [Spirochaetota bacterium]